MSLIKKKRFITAGAASLAALLITLGMVAPASAADEATAPVEDSTVTSQEVVDTTEDAADAPTTPEPVSEAVSESEAEPSSVAASEPVSEPIPVSESASEPAPVVESEQAPVESAPVAAEQPVAVAEAPVWEPATRIVLSPTPCERADNKSNVDFAYSIAPGEIPDTLYINGNATVGDATLVLPPGVYTYAYDVFNVATQETKHVEGGTFTIVSCEPAVWTPASKLVLTQRACTADGYNNGNVSFSYQPAEGELIEKTKIAGTVVGDGTVFLAPGEYPYTFEVRNLATSEVKTVEGGVLVILPCGSPDDWNVAVPTESNINLVCAASGPIITVKTQSTPEAGQSQPKITVRINGEIVSQGRADASGEYSFSSGVLAVGEYSVGVLANRWHVGDKFLQVTEGMCDPEPPIKEVVVTPLSFEGVCDGTTALGVVKVKVDVPEGAKPVVIALFHSGDTRLGGMLTVDKSGVYTFDGPVPAGTTKVFVTKDGETVGEGLVKAPTCVKPTPSPEPTTDPTPTPVPTVDPQPTVQPQPAAQPVATKSDDTTKLATTGGSDQSGVVGFGLGLLLLGAITLVMARRRKVASRR